MYKIPLYKPCIGELEKKLVNQALDTCWISSRGNFINQFENDFAKFFNKKYALSVCNGTCALHLALISLDLKPNTAVLCPTLTYVSTANVIRYCGLIPIFVDCDECGISEYEHFKEGIEVAKSNNIEISAIIAVHLYGSIPNIEKIKQFNIPIIQDCAESFGSTLHGVKSGSENVEFSCFSFFGNKTITTGEGGMIVGDNEDLMHKVKIYRSVGQLPTASQRYMHVNVGYNYRMTNIAAAIGIGQLSNANLILSNKKRVFSVYNDRLKKNNINKCLLPTRTGLDSNYWLVTLITKSNIMREGLILYLESKGIETRPTFLCMHAMLNLGDSFRSNSMKNSETISSCGINLPSYPELSDDEVNIICDHIIDFYKRY